MTNPLDPALFRPDAMAPETRQLNQTMVQLLTPMPDWWVTGAEASRAARRRGDGPFPAPVMSPRAQTRSIPETTAMRSRCASLLRIGRVAST